MRGYFISFEGIDGSGKSTQINKLKEFLEQNGYDVLLTREPGGTKISEKIRNIILDADNKEMTDMTEAFLYAASRAQIVEEVIKPAIDSGKIVICDRYVDSSIAYQGDGRKLGDFVEVINSYAVQNIMPDLTVFMKVEPTIGNDRISNREKDRIELEAQDFHMAVYNGYDNLEKRFPDRIKSVDATRSIDEIHNNILEHVKGLLK
jgi:dTMP kinase